MKLNFNFDLLDLNGKNIKDQDGNNLSANIFLAQSLAQSAKGNAIKLIEMALKLNKEEELDLDTVDSKFLENFIEELQVSNIVKYRLLTMF